MISMEFTSATVGARPTVGFSCPRLCRNVINDGVKRPKPCPDQSEGTLEIATGCALATTSSDCHAPYIYTRNDK
jgi:hypothetical protein